LMMENRSFDHMLGYLRKPNWLLGDETDKESMVEGLDQNYFVTWQGVDYAVFPLGTSRWEPPAYEDPPHDGRSVGWQVKWPHTFVSTYLAQNEQRKHTHAKPGGVMGYLTGNEVPVYDFLARQYCVCDHWHCSVPGATWPNRMFALAGTSGGETDIPQTVLEGLWGKRTFFNELDARNVSWRWYSSDPSLLRAFDSNYRTDDRTDRFAYFDQRSERQPRNFLTDARDGLLPSVSWIDPNFFDLGASKKILEFLDDGMPANDDHPPHDVMLGQTFIHLVYQALRNSRNWESSLMIIVYDEHGGFYDHVEVPEPYGPRVPALLVSPWVEPGRPCHALLDHCSIIKTILRRFADSDAIERMGPRVYRAGDVWHMLTEDEARPGPPVNKPGEAAIADDRHLHSRRLEAGRSTIHKVLEAIDTYAAGDPKQLKDAEGLVDLQRDLILVYGQLRRVLPWAVGTRLVRVTRYVPAVIRQIARALARPLLKRLPERVRPMPDRMP
jgi:phospholipase C